MGPGQVPEQESVYTEVRFVYLVMNHVHTKRFELTSL